MKKNNNHRDGVPPGFGSMHDSDRGDGRPRETMGDPVRRPTSFNGCLSGMQCFNTVAFRGRLNSALQTRTFNSLTILHSQQCKTCNICDRDVMPKRCHKSTKKSNIFKQGHQQAVNYHFRIQAGRFCMQINQ